MVLIVFIALPVSWKTPRKNWSLYDRSNYTL